MTKFKEAVSLLSSQDATDLEGPRVRVVLITEGLGNRVNMNYYGPEAIESAPEIFEGKPAFLNHPSESEERDIPERRVQDKCGYFKNVRSGMYEGRKALFGDLHFDLSESGREAYNKALTALHYSKEFPNTEDVYVGLSINADGEAERRKIVYEGETVEVNYVKKFVGASSCDVVTAPGRGGRFLALVESAAGAYMKENKEEGQMKRLKESLKAAHSALQEANKETDAEKKSAKLAEAAKLFDGFLQEADAMAVKVKGKEADDDMESKGKEAFPAKSKKKEADDADADEDDDADKAKMKKEKKEKKESNRIVAESLCKEAGIEVDEWKLDKLSDMPLTEAKGEIESMQKMQEAIIRNIEKKMQVPVAHFDKLTEAERTVAGSKNNELFAGLTR